MSTEITLDHLAEANPVPEHGIEIDDSMLLLAIRERSVDMSTSTENKATKGIPPTGSPEGPKRPMGWLVALAAFAVVVMVGAVALLATSNTETPPASTPTTQAPPAEVTTTISQVTTTVSPTTTVATIEAPPAPATPLMVEVNGAQLAYECRGEGSPTVIVELGTILTSPESTPLWNGWGEALDGISQETQVCTYARRGVLGSDAVGSDTPRTADDQVDDLDGLITELGINTPVVLAGEYQAGYNIRVFTERYPDKVAGLVFIDALHPEVDLREQGMADHFLRAPEWFDYPASAVQAQATGDLGDLPIFVLWSDEDGFGAATRDWADHQEALAALSTDTRLKGVGDRLSLPIKDDNPDEIVKAVRSVITRSS